LLLLLIPLPVPYIIVVFFFHPLLARSAVQWQHGF
jgi:hypothetical protein